MRILRQAYKKNVKTTSTNEIIGVPSVVSNSILEISNDKRSEPTQTRSFDSTILAPSPQTKRKIVIIPVHRKNKKKTLLFKKTDSTTLTTEMLETLHSNLKSSCKNKKFPWRKHLISEEIKSKVVNTNHLQA